MLKDCWTLLHCTFWVLLLSALHLKNPQKPVWTRNFFFFLSFPPPNASFEMTVWFYYSVSDTAYATYSIHSEETKQHLVYCHPTFCVTASRVWIFQAHVQPPHVCSEAQSPHSCWLVVLRVMSWCRWVCIPVAQVFLCFFREGLP